MKNTFIFTHVFSISGVIHFFDSFFQVSPVLLLYLGQKQKALDWMLNQKQNIRYKRLN